MVRASSMKGQPSSLADAVGATPHELPTSAHDKDARLHAIVKLEQLQATKLLWNLRTTTWTAALQRRYTRYRSPSLSTLPFFLRWLTLYRRGSGNRLRLHHFRRCLLRRPREWVLDHAEREELCHRRCQSDSSKSRYRNDDSRSRHQ